MTSAALRIRTRLFDALQRAFGEFLALPILVLIAFIALAVMTYLADSYFLGDAVTGVLALLDRLLGDSGAIGSLLSTVASSIITVTSITFSLLLIAVQQGASALTTQVTDQFLMRRANQFYFGFFVGLSVYVLITLVTVSGSHRPLIGATVALLLTTVALCLMVLLIYSTIDQMRPGRIVQAIQRHVLEARRCELDLLGRTRRRGGFTREPDLRIRMEDSGLVAAIDIDALQGALAAHLPSATMEILVPVGGYAAFGDPIAAIWTTDGGAKADTIAEHLKEDVFKAVSLTDARDLKRDPSFGVYQLGMIGWTSGSTAKSNPSPALAVVQALRDILSRWIAAGEPPEDRQSPVVYRDRSPIEVLDTLEAVGVVASESIQPQTLAAVLRTLALLLPQATPEIGAAIADICRRQLSCLGEHVLTRETEAALRELNDALDAAGFDAVAAETRAARRVFSESLGKLGSRSTRAPTDFGDPS